MNNRVINVIAGAIFSLPIFYAISCSNPQIERVGSSFSDADAQTINSAPNEPSLIDVPKAPSTHGTVEPFRLDPPFLSSLPYYCDPTRYSPSVINNNRACDRFKPIPYLGYGLDYETPIEYRIRQYPGRVGYGDDDDDNRYGRYRRKHYDR